MEKEKRTYNFEIYLVEPISGQSGWEIVIIDVFAESRKEAESILGTVPNFDEIILFNYDAKMDEGDIAAWAMGDNYRFLI
jgi:hypothetical protein